MGKKKSKAPEQPTTKTNMGLFGTTTTGKAGSTFDPTQFQKTFTGNAEGAILNAQNAINNQEISEQAIDNMNRQFNTDFKNELLNPALENNWLRGSSANDVMSIANQDYQNRRYDLLQTELARQQQLKSNALADYLSMYDIAKGSTGLSNALNQANAQYALEAYKANKQGNSGLLGQLMGGIGQLGGLALGGYLGGKGGAKK